MSLFSCTGLTGDLLLRVETKADVCHRRARFRRLIHS